MALQFFKIPLASAPQTFRITLGGIDYQMTLTYRNATEGAWVLDISDTAGNMIVAGIPLVSGADLLAQYKSLGFKGRLWVKILNNTGGAPGFNDLGVSAFLYWVQ